MLGRARVGMAPAGRVSSATTSTSSSSPTHAWRLLQAPEGSYPDAPAPRLDFVKTSHHAGGSPAPRPYSCPPTRDLRGRDPAATHRSTARPLPPRARAGPRRHGVRLPGRGPEAPPAGRDEGAPARPRRRRWGPTAFSVRSRWPRSCSIPRSCPCTTAARPTARSSTSCPTWRASRFASRLARRASCRWKRPPGFCTRCSTRWPTPTAKA